MPTQTHEIPRISRVQFSLADYQFAWNATAETGSCSPVSEQRSAGMWIASEGYGFKSDGQFSTIMIGLITVSPAGVSVRNRWPSADTT
jgi:hypothetical protein